jgi:hypothetical protein
MSRDVAQTSLILDDYPFRSAPLLVEPSIPHNHLIMRHPVNIDYFIKNLSTEVIELKLAVERAENVSLYRFLKLSKFKMFRVKKSLRCRIGKR